MTRPPGPSTPDPEAAREEASHYADLQASLRAWAQSWPGSPHPAQPEASHDEPEAGQ